MSDAPAPLVSIVIVTYNAPHHVRQCLADIRARTSVPFEVVVVDNASEAETRDLLRAEPGIRLILNDDNRLWSAGCNQGIAAAHPAARYVLLLNSDIEILRDDWLRVMVDLMESDARVGLVGPVHRAVELGPVYGFIDGQCLLMRRELLAEIGPLDAERWPWSGAAAEYAVAAYARGWIYKVVHRDDRLIRHHGEGSKTPEVRAKLARLPRAAGQLADVMRRHGVRPRRALWDGKWLPKGLRAMRDRRRFYYAPPAGGKGGLS
jgi:GT2 family glycosyltransferase